MAKEPRFDHIRAEISVDMANSQLDRNKRRQAIRKLEKLMEADKRRVAMYYARRDRSLSHEVLLPFTNMLQSIGTAENLDLIIVSPGGDGTAAERILELVRNYCAGCVRAVVPLYAKSAATLIALGSDEIIMGETSELGPIDAQVFIVEGNNPQQVSADHFLRARDAAIGDLTSTDQNKKEAAQIQLSLLSPAYLQFCADSMQFGKDFAASQLQAHMFASEHAADPATWVGRIEKIVANLTSSSHHLTHGRMITARAISEDDDLKHLKVTALERDDPYWRALNELLIRTEIVVQTAGGQIGQILFARDFELVGG